MLFLLSIIESSSAFLFFSEIVEEGKMTCFLLASIAMLGLRRSIMTKKMTCEVSIENDV